MFSEGSYDSLTFLFAHTELIMVPRSIALDFLGRFRSYFKKSKRSLPATFTGFGSKYFFFFFKIQRVCSPFVLWLFKTLSGSFVFQNIFFLWFLKNKVWFLTRSFFTLRFKNKKHGFFVPFSWTQSIFLPYFWQTRGFWNRKTLFLLFFFGNPKSLLCFQNSEFERVCLNFESGGLLLGFYF